jgi:hypothetical protein
VSSCRGGLRAASTTFAGREVIVAAPRKAYPILKKIPTEPRPDIHTSQVTLPSGEPLKNEPFEMKVPFRFNLSDMINGDVDAFTTSVEASGRAYGEDTMRSVVLSKNPIDGAHRGVFHKV